MVSHSWYEMSLLSMGESYWIGNLYELLKNSTQLTIEVAQNK